MSDGYLRRIHKRALLHEQDDLIKHKEHCSADPEKLATVGRALGHQVRIKRNNQEYGLYTVSEVRQETPDKIVRMGQSGRERLGKSGEFEGTARLTGAKYDALRR